MSRADRSTGPPGAWTPHLTIALFAAASGAAEIAFAAYTLARGGPAGFFVPGVLLLLLALWPYHEHLAARRERALPARAPRPVKGFFRRELSVLQLAAFMGAVGVLTLADDVPELAAGDRGEIWSVLNGVLLLAMAVILVRLDRLRRAVRRPDPDDVPSGPP